MSVQPFTQVEGGLAVLRTRNGIQKQTNVYHRGGELFVPVSGGFVRVVSTRFDDYWATAHPDVKVLEIEGAGIQIKDREVEFQHGD